MEQKDKKEIDISLACHLVIRFKMLFEQTPHQVYRLRNLPQKFVARKKEEKRALWYSDRCVASDLQGLFEQDSDFFLYDGAWRRETEEGRADYMCVLFKFWRKTIPDLRKRSLLLIRPAFEVTTDARLWKGAALLGSLLDAGVPCKDPMSFGLTFKEPEPLPQKCSRSTISEIAKSQRGVDLPDRLYFLRDKILVV